MIHNYAYGCTAFFWEGFESGELSGRHAPRQGKSFAVIRAAQKKNIENIANRSNENCTRGDQGQ